MQRQYMFFDNFDDFCKKFDIGDVVKLRTFKTAMTHSSVSKKNNYERLEFLGDTLLNFCISKMIYESFPNEQEGCMSRLKSFLVSRKMCRKVAKDIKLDTQVIVAEQQDMSKESVTADIVESFLCVVYYQYGLDKVLEIVYKLFRPYADLDQMIDAKSKLQEITQKRYRKLPEYSLISKTGLEHSPIFKVRVACDDLYADGVGDSKKNAEIMAARKLLDLINSNGKR